MVACAGASRNQAGGLTEWRLVQTEHHGPLQREKPLSHSILHPMEGCGPTGHTLRFSRATRNGDCYVNLQLFKCWQMTQLSLQKNLHVDQQSMSAGSTDVAQGPPDCGLGLNTALTKPTHRKKKKNTISRIQTHDWCTYTHKWRKEVTGNSVYLYSPLFSLLFLNYIGHD